MYDAQLSGAQGMHDTSSYNDQELNHAIGSLLAEESLRVQILEAHAARDAVINRLASASQSIQDKSSIVAQLRREKRELQEKLDALVIATKTEHPPPAHEVVLKEELDKENMPLVDSARVGKPEMSNSYYTVSLTWLNYAFCD
jgi:hypothetical protein